MMRVASGIVLVDGASTPSPELIERYREYADLSFPEKTVDDWYCLLEKAQGDLSLYHRGLKHMIDDHEFLQDSFYCEWAYIVNLDTGKFEAYRGFNKDTSAPGRYASKEVHDSPGYKGVVLVKEVPLLNITESRVDDLIKELEIIEKEEEEDYEQTI